MAAASRNLRSRLKSNRKHYGFGQEPVSSKSTKPKNYLLAKFVLEKGRLPEDGELAEFERSQKINN